MQLSSIQQQFFDIVTYWNQEKISTFLKFTSTHIGSVSIWSKGNNHSEMLIVINSNFLLHLENGKIDTHEIANNKQLMFIQDFYGKRGFTRQEIVL